MVTRGSLSRGWVWLSCLALLAATGISPCFAANLIEKSAHGAVGVQTIDVLGFGPEGLLLIGDGKGSQVVAVVTGDTKALSPIEGKIADVRAKLASRLGAKGEGIEILDMAVNPASGKVYFAVRKQDDKAHLILTLDGRGEVGEFSLESVDYCRLPLPADRGASVGKVTDVAWADDRILAAASASEEFASKIFTVMAPLVHDAKGQIASAETYHVSHHKWETKAPMSVLMPFKEDGKMYVAGAFACTPVVKYPVDAIQQGAKVKGTSVIELGSGNRPIDMIAYQKDGKEYVLSNTLRFHHQRKPFGPSPYWTVRFERSLLDEEENVNEKAIYRLGKNDAPATERIQMIESLHGVTQLDKLDDRRALVLRTAEGGTFDLEAVPLP